jgi:hypothetical protein
LSEEDGAGGVGTGEVDRCRVLSATAPSGTEADENSRSCSGVIEQVGRSYSNSLQILSIICRADALSLKL